MFDVRWGFLHLVLLYLFTKMVSPRKKKNQQKRQLSQLNETLNDFVIVNDANVSAMGNET